MNNAGSRHGEAVIVSDSISKLNAVTNLRNNKAIIEQIRNQIVGLIEEADPQRNMAASREGSIGQNDTITQLKLSIFCVIRRETVVK